MLAALALATFVTALDNTVVNVALPRIQADLALSTTDLEWIATSYILVFASLMIAGGRFADRFGRRRTFVTGLAVFGIASLAAGFAPGAGLLIAARAAQGLGGALILPASLSILGADVSPRARQVGAGVATAVAAASLALGPLVGGAISQYWHWSGIFFVNVPVVVVTIALTYCAIPSLPGADRHNALDLPGIALIGLTMAGITWLLTEGLTYGMTSAITLCVGGATIASAVAFGFAARGGRSVILDRTLLRNRVFTGAIVAQTLWGLGVNGVFFYTSLFLQNVLRASPSQAGLTFIPLAVALGMAIPIVGPTVSRIGARMTIALGLLLVAAGLFWVSTVSLGSSLRDLLPAMIIIGVGSALTIPLTSLALGAVTGPRMGMASSLITASREIAGIFGITFVGAIIVAREHILTAAGMGARAAFLDGYQQGLRAAALLTVLGAVTALVLLRTSAPPPDSASATQRGRLIEARAVVGE